MFQRLLVWMLGLMRHQLITSVSAKIESFHSGERLLPMRNISYMGSSMRSYVLLAYRHVCSCWSEPTALLCASSVWLCQRSWVCVISGGMDNSVMLSIHSLPSSQVPVQSVSRDSLGRWQTTKDAPSFSYLRKVKLLSQQSVWIVTHHLVLNSFNWVGERSNNWFFDCF